MKQYSLLSSDYPGIQKWIFSKKIDAHTVLFGALLISRTILRNVKEDVNIYIKFTDGRNVFEAHVKKQQYINDEWYYHGQVHNISHLKNNRQNI
jgi:hypothetical protein